VHGAVCEPRLVQLCFFFLVIDRLVPFFICSFLWINFGSIQISISCPLYEVSVMKEG
jgi:hypothetical protein